MYHCTPSCELRSKNHETTATLSKWSQLSEIEEIDIDLFPTGLAHKKVMILSIHAVKLCSGLKWGWTDLIWKDKHWSQKPSLFQQRWYHHWSRITFKVWTYSCTFQPLANVISVSNLDFRLCYLIWPIPFPINSDVSFSRFTHSSVSVILYEVGPKGSCGEALFIHASIYCHEFEAGMWLNKVNTSAFPVVYGAASWCKKIMDQYHRLWPCRQRKCGADGEKLNVLYPANHSFNRVLSVHCTCSRKII